MIRVLLSNTSLKIRFNGIITDAFNSNIGSPQGDALSPILFAIYLEYALRLLREKVQRPKVDLEAAVPGELIYADDTDFISLDKSFLDDILRVVGSVFGELNIIVNTDKTEHTIIGHHDVVKDQQAWKETKKLGSKLGVEEDVARRKVLATQCFNKFKYIWKRSNKVSKTIRMMTYKTIVESVLLFNCSTWALSIKEADNLDTYQRRLLRKILGHVWSDKVSNEDLYKEAGVVPASLQVLDARWRLFGHILRMNENTPARKAMVYYFAGDQKGRKGPRITIATSLSNEYYIVHGKKLDSLEALNEIASIAQDRNEWKEITSKVVQSYADMQSNKRLVQKQKRKGEVVLQNITHNYLLRSRG